MSKTRLIVFSYNRPMQLDATLDSVQANLRRVVDQNDVTVIFRATTPYMANYERLKESWKVNWVEESDFKQDVLNAMVQKYNSDRLLFLTDDDIVFEKVDPVGCSLLSPSGCFSLRLGRNIEYCYSNNKPNKVKNEYQTLGTIHWKWREQELDFAYPLSVTAHIFTLAFIRELTEKCEFENPNVYEGQLQQHLDKCWSMMSSFVKSHVVGIPANRVNESCMNRHGLKYKYTTEELNDKFTEGYRIDWESMDFSNITAAQQELEYVFRKD